MMRKTWLLLGLASLLAAPAAHAVDGVVEINAAAAARGGVTPGDTPGLPVTLSVQGSYRLTGDLETTDLSQRMIDVTAANVSLDLNGFRVGQCFEGDRCTAGSEDAIRALVDAFEVRNGVVQGAAGRCVRTGDGAVVSDLRVRSCGIGIFAGTNSRIQRVTVEDSIGKGVVMGPGAILRDSVVADSGGAGVEVSFRGLILDTVIEQNDGAIVSSGGSIFTAVGYRGCLITLNDGNNEVQPIPPSLRSLGQNLCGSDFICP